jgi:thiol-disulfide isomerase/thioredoxin
MSSALIAGLAIAAALVAACLIGCVVSQRSGVLRESKEPIQQGNSDLGLSDTGPTVLHFSADWCGPCAMVRRVVDQVCANLPDVTHVELDIDANPVAARRLSVLSLPTTFIFDTQGQQRYRSAGVPKAADLLAALQPLRV